MASTLRVAPAVIRCCSNEIVPIGFLQHLSLAELHQIHLTYQQQGWWGSFRLQKSRWTMQAWWLLSNLIALMKMRNGQIICIIFSGQFIKDLFSLHKKTLSLVRVQTASTGMYLVWKRIIWTTVHLCLKQCQLLFKTLFVFVLRSARTSCTTPGQGGIKCANRRTGFIDSEGSHR